MLDSDKAVVDTTPCTGREGVAPVYVCERGRQCAFLDQVQIRMPPFTK